MPNSDLWEPQMLPMTKFTHTMNTYQNSNDESMEDMLTTIVQQSADTVGVERSSSQAFKASIEPSELFICQISTTTPSRTSKKLMKTERRALA